MDERTVKLFRELVEPMRVPPGTKVKLARDFDPGATAKLVEKDDAFITAEVNTGARRHCASDVSRSSGVEDRGTHDIAKTWQPGRSLVLFHGWE